MSLAPTKLINFPQAMPDSAGIPEAVRNEMLVAPYNDIDFLRSLVAEHGHEIAGLIVEPLQRIIPPEAGFLQAVREICDDAGIVLIFDEVVTGFRLSYGGAQEFYGVTPDVCTLGKAIGGGFPLAAIAGREEIMRHFDKGAVGADKWLMQLGTLSGNPVASIAGIKTLEILRRPGMYDRLRQSGEALQASFAKHLDAHGVEHKIVGDATLFDICFTNRDIRDYRDYLTHDQKKNGVFNKVLRENGIFKSPGKVYPSMALTEEDLQMTDAAIEKAAKAVAAMG